MGNENENAKDIKPLSLKSLSERIDKIVTDTNDRLQVITKSLVLTAQAMQKLSDNVYKLGKGNVNAQQIRDMIFKELNVKTGWAKADVKAMIDKIFNALSK